MIVSFQKIKGIGRYKNFVASNISIEQGANNFQQYNLICGENGSGKTTLAHILRSLKGNNELLLKKKTFGYLDSPEVQIKVNQSVEKELVYHNFKWQEHNPNIEIFDVYFINDNIYTGLEIQNNHKKKLFEIILGGHGVQLKNEIQTIKIRIQKGNKIVRESSRALESRINNAYTALDYANLAPDAEILEKIKLKKKELETANNHQTIQEKAPLSILPKIDLPFQTVAIRDILQQSLDFISQNYLEKFQTHKASLNMGGKVEEWLKQGFEAKHDAQCPFCLQKIDESTEIIEAYNQYFNATYKQLLLDIDRIQIALNEFNLEAGLLKIENALIINKNLVEFWKNYLPNAPVAISIATEKKLILTVFEKIKMLVQQKMSNPLQAIDFSILQEFDSISSQLTEKLEEVNTQISAYNESIELMKAYEDTDISRTERELNQLLAIEKRGELEVEQHCQNLIKYTAAIAKLKKQNEQKKEELNQFKGIVFSSYLTIINRHLKHFAPYLSLRKLTSGYLGSSTEPVVKFAICINGKEVLHKEKNDRPSMKYSLSEGDKSALALAFFLAKLEADDNLGDKIIIFDDSVSSFDRNRLSKLLDQLIGFGQKARQLFFLTHNLRVGEEFARRVEKSEIIISKNRLSYIKETAVITKF